MGGAPQTKYLFWRLFAISAVCKLKNVEITVFLGKNSYSVNPFDLAVRTTVTTIAPIVVDHPS